MLWTFSGTGVQGVAQLVVSDGAGPAAHADRLRAHGRGRRDHRALADRLAGRRGSRDRSAPGSGRRRTSGSPSRSPAASGSCWVSRRLARRAGARRLLPHPRSRARASAAWRCCSPSTASTRSASRSSFASCDSGCSSPSSVGSYILGYASSASVLAWQGYGVWALVAANVSQVTVRTVGDVRRHHASGAAEPRPAREPGSPQLRLRTFAGAGRRSALPAGRQPGGRPLARVRRRSGSTAAPTISWSCRPVCSARS